MWASRDQENVIHGRQSVGAAKTVNPRTPFGVPRKHTNLVGAPLGTKSRAPLGVKTTNAKATSFKTPIGKVTKSDNAEPGTRPRPKQPQTQKVRDVEYMPPRAKELPDLPDDLLPDLDFSALNPAFCNQAMARYYEDAEDDEGLTAAQRYRRELDRELFESEQKAEAVIAEQLAQITIPDEREGDRAEPSHSASQKAASLLSIKRPLARRPGPKKPVASRKMLTHSQGRAVSSFLRNPEPNSQDTRQKRIQPPGRVKLPVFSELFLEEGFGEEDFQLEILSRSDEQ